MIFSVREVIQTMRGRAPNPGDLDATQIALQFNTHLRDLVLEYVTHDPERLSEEAIIPESDVDVDPVDVTTAGLIEWLVINGVDWRKSDTADFDGQVVIATQEARHRAATEYAHLGEPIGYFIDRHRAIRKVNDWSGVHDIQILGVPAPDPIQPGQWDQEFDYPAPLFRALQYQMQVSFAAVLGGDGGLLNLWLNELQTARQAMLLDAKDHVTGNVRVEDVPHVSFYQ